jgi:tryptophan synthase beta subunit
LAGINAAQLSPLPLAGINAAQLSPLPPAPTDPDATRLSGPISVDLSAALSETPTVSGTAPNGAAGRLGPTSNPSTQRDASMHTAGFADAALRRAVTPDVVVACVGGGSNAAGTFAGFVDTGARLVGVEAAGGAAMTGGVPGVVHGYRSLVLQDAHGQVMEAESIAAGLDYPGVGPEHAHLGASGRAEYKTVTDAEVLDAVHRLARAEGILCALESAHAVAWVLRAAGTPELPAGSTVVLTLSGRGDKDMTTLMEATR